MTDKGLDLSAPALESRILPGLGEVEELLEQSVASRRGFVAELIGHLSSAGGKRLRPVLALVAAQLGQGGEAEEADVVKAATLVELTHLASLYHDDVMDSAPTRRGVDSAHHLWGNNRAILAGDVLFARASKLTAELGPETVGYHAHIFERMCEGQLNESFGPTAADDPVDFYLQVLADKTGALVAAAAYLGALHGGADIASARAVEAFGEKIGVAFQIADDVLDIASPAEVSGKTPGTDLREGVDTLPVLLLRQQAQDGTIDPAGSKILAALAGSLEDDEVLAAVVEDFRRHPVLNETRRMAREWADDAKAQLASLPDGEVRAALEAFADLMTDREV